MTPSFKAPQSTRLCLTCLVLWLEEATVPFRPNMEPPGIPRVCSCPSLVNIVWKLMSPLKQLLGEGQRAQRSNNDRQRSRLRWESKWAHHWVLGALWVIVWRRSDVQRPQYIPSLWCKGLFVGEASLGVCVADKGVSGGGIIFASAGVRFLTLVKAKKRCVHYIWKVLLSFL